MKTLRTTSRRTCIPSANNNNGAMMMIMIMLMCFLISTKSQQGRPSGFLVLLVFSLISAPFPFTALAYPYNRPGCSGWPSEKEWDADLRAQLSDPSHLYGPFFDNPGQSYEEQCFKKQDQQNQTSDNILAGGQGLCMNSHACVNEKCHLYERHNVPAYTVQADSIPDIQAVLRFANQYDIAVSIKSSGHNYQGQSMQADSLLVWMRHFPFTNHITTDFVDSCGTNHGPTISIAGGETAYNVVEGGKDKYNVVVGECPTVCISGGWLQGGGMSPTLTRAHGYGVDQATSFQVVLADASVVTADACTNANLFWALRGGGGGNFGIVTSVEYKLHHPAPVSPVVTSLSFNFNSGSRYLPIVDKNTKLLIREWVNFFVRNLPAASTQWSGGFISPTTASLTFLGSLEEAKSSDLVTNMDIWYDNLVDNGVEPGCDRPSDTLVEFPSHYDYKLNEYRMNEYATVAVPPSLGRGYSRIIPQQAVNERTDELIDLIIELGYGGGLVNIYYLGGAANEVPTNETAVHPGLRNAAFGLEPANDSANQLVLDFAGNKAAEWSVSYNHHNVLKNDWKNMLWGANHYSRLQEIKVQYDPKHRFNVYHGVNFKSRDERHDCGKDDLPNISHSKFFMAFINQIWDNIKSLFGN